MAYGKLKVDTLVYDKSGVDTEIAVSSLDGIAGTVKKIHTFEYSSRVTASSTGGTNQFTWTSSFTPLDATNNSFIFTASVPCNGADNDYCGFGLRIGNQDYQGYGVRYVDEANLTHQDYHFVIGPGVLSTSANQSIYHRIYTNNSNPDFYFPNTRDDSRLGAQTRGFLTVIEFKNS